MAILLHLQHLSSSTSSTCPPRHPHSSQPTNRQEEEGLMAELSSQAKRPDDEPPCLPGQEHEGEDGLLFLHPLTSHEEKMDPSSSTVMSSETKG